jgi:hypothetical protein
MQLMKMKRDEAAAAAAPSPATTTVARAHLPSPPPRSTSPRSKTDQALAEAPPGMSRLQAMAWQRRREHKRRALLKVRALIFMTGARGLAAAESNGGVVPRAVLKQDDEPDGGDGAKSPKPRVIAQLEAKRGSMARRRWMKIRSFVFMTGAMGLRKKLDAADRATRLVPPPGLSAKERIRWRGERKANIKRAMLKLRAVIAISGAAGLRDPNSPPDNLSPMEKLKWKAARKQESENRAREETSMRASDTVTKSKGFHLQPFEEITAVPLRGDTWAEGRSPVPAVVNRVLGRQHSPPVQRLSDTPHLRLSQPELDGVVAAEDDHAVGDLHEGVYGRTVRRLETTARAVDHSVRSTDYHGKSAFLGTHERPRPSPSRSFSQPTSSQPWLRRAVTARSPIRPQARSPVNRYRQQQQQVKPALSPGRSPSVRSGMGMQVAYQEAATAVGGADGGRYQNGLGMVSERIASLQMERAVLATRHDFEGRSRLAEVESELRATQAVIKLAQEQLGRVRRSKSRSSRSRGSTSRR